MLIAGAGGHALEVLDLLVCAEPEASFVFLDELSRRALFQEKYPVIQSQEEVLEAFLSDPRFVLGTGKPAVRKRLYEKLRGLEGRHVGLRGTGSLISPSARCGEADILNFCFVGPNTQIGLGCLINTGAQIHHEVILGEFSEVNPGAIVLGAAQIGSFSSIGANATVLPKVKIGDRVTVGAGAVVTQDLPDGATAVGVPARVIK
ncbi:acetyltransferase [Algoriphagus sp. H41]|uniref:Acetyltransferase n=1 Tax=Algoriphagus oliviformis TaxID=2811231 RepID=A0ABS3C8N8_9BACT|nr:acetyltransferase [Algoriphagus oliviformis]MBN7812939.1 acetyltransferase [Algoriphagus oliviformis]